MVMLTKPDCPACKGMKGQVHGGTAVKDLLEKFIVVHANAEKPEGEAWKKFTGVDEKDVPQMYWFSAGGEHLNIKGVANPEYRYFFTADWDLADGMTRAIDKNPELSCAAGTLEDCNDKETKFVGAWKNADKAKVSKEINRLQGMKTGQMAKDKKLWLRQRIALLRQVLGKDEL